MALVADLAVAWVQGDDHTLSPWLVDDFSHDIFGPRPPGGGIRDSGPNGT